jgi:beta-galactosidase
MRQTRQAGPFRVLLWTLVIAASAPAAEAAREGEAVPLPQGEQAHWGEEPVESLTPVRGRICLNGLWHFMPATRPDAGAQEGRGWIRVPGTWNGYWKLPGVVARGAGPAWQDVDLRELARAWYERTVPIPAEWAGRAVLLELVRVSTDALVYANGVECGRVEWPGGAVDITDAIEPGAEADLRVLVVAAPGEQEAVTYMGVAENQVFTRPADLPSRGIIGEVFLLSRPRGPHVSDIFVQTSTRDRELALDVELTGVAEPGTVELLARALDEDGREERRFTARAAVEPAETQLVRAAWDWPDPRLWDMRQPSLYDLVLQVSGAGIEDVYRQRFGFREFWIEGTRFFLNGKEMRLRPHHWSEEAWSNVSGVAEAIDNALEGALWAGYNLLELWPGNHDARGTVQFRELICERADLKGLPVTGVALAMNGYIYDSRWRFTWDEPGVQERYERRMAAELRRYRNHPSVVMWGTSGNFFGHWQDQNPRTVGRRGWADHDEGFRRRADAGEEGIAIIKRHDPTRPVFTHHGAYVGDVHTVNSYLCMTPLQEREEWLSHWAEHGEMPYWVVEFGTPLHCTFMRGRAGGGWGRGTGATYSEPLMTEFCAIYLGTEAYEKETPQYRARIVERFREGQLYKNWQGNAELDYAPANQMLQSLFSTNTFRSWRTMGTTGGMYPWSDGHGWEGTADHDEPVELGPFRPGRRGTYYRTVPKARLQHLKPIGQRILPAGRALLANNGPTLAWIAGPPEAFTAKDHSFDAGQRVEKQIVVINDTRSPQPFSFEWRATVGRRRVANGAEAGQAGVAQTLFFPIAFDAPAETDAPKVDGEIRLEATIGGRRHEDAFGFRVFAPEEPAGPSVAVFDPEGETTRLLRLVGCETRPWDGAADLVLVVVGRKALSGGHEPPGDLEAFVRGGGRAVVFAQHPDWMRDYWGLRVSPHLARRAFPVSADHPALAGLDAEDLRDWTGESTLVEAYPDPPWDEIRRGGYGGCPWHGWHWGNRGAVSSAPVEKPHRSGWRPILECEFDLAYSPLMELDCGAGRLILCTLDLEDHAAADPAALRTARRLLDYAAGAPVEAKAERVVYVGGDAGAGLLDELGVLYERVEGLEGPADLVIVGPEAAPEEGALAACAERGGRALFLPRKGGSAPLGVRLTRTEAFGGSLHAPDWPEAGGLSASDLRWRTDHPAWIVTDGCQIGANGLLGRKQVGRGVAVFCQADPNRFDCERMTYFRYTRWRQTRALAQVLANMGATFALDARIFRPRHPDYYKVRLDGPWRARLTARLGPSPSLEQPHPDPGMTDEAKRAVAEAFDDSDWAQMPLPQLWEQVGGEWEAADGEAVFRTAVEVPEHLAGRELVLSLGPVDDFDETYFNGELVGSTDASTAQHWQVPRLYTVPARLVRPGRNVVAVRVFDHFGGGGFGGEPEQMYLELKRDKDAESFYHRDYRDDFDYGDDPYRYCRW